MQATNIFETHKDDATPPAGVIFVFGANLAGRHGAGAAKHAAIHFGAQYGVGIGRTGQAYAIPTKGFKLGVLPRPLIAKYVNDFLAYVVVNSDSRFYLTRVGCGLAGYSDSEIAPLFLGVPKNVNLPVAWLRFLYEKNTP